MAAKKKKAFKLTRVQWRKLIAMHGATGEEMAEGLKLDMGQTNSFLRHWSGIEDQLEFGRTPIDEDIMKALEERAIGSILPDTKTHFDGGQFGSSTWKTMEVEKHFPPDTLAIKYWLGNRKKAQWTEKHQLEVGGKDEASSIHVSVRDESKLELVASILSLITPKPDGDPGDNGS